MNILENVPLSTYSTMGLGGCASFLIEINSKLEILEAVSWAQTKKLPMIMVGTGSNIIWQDDGYPGLILVNKILGYEKYNEDDENIYLNLGAGEILDSIVERSVQDNLSGIEALSLIPGTVGALPIQNVGAYGQEISQTLVSVTAFDLMTSNFVTIKNDECSFSYRNSRFKTIDRGRFFITEVTLHLTKSHIQPPFYSALEEYFNNHNLKEYSPNIVRKAIIEIRQKKLPDPAIIKNCGSFFANPIIPIDQLKIIEDSYNNFIPNWPVNDNYTKISAAWLIDHCGFRDYSDQETGMATWKNQSLVLINNHCSSTKSLLAFKNKLVSAVQIKFNIVLQQEPELLP